MSAPRCTCGGTICGLTVRGRQGGSLRRLYRCSGCRRLVPWCFGAADDASSLCDDCWGSLQEVAERGVAARVARAIELADLSALQAESRLGWQRGRLTELKKAIDEPSLAELEALSLLCDVRAAWLAEGDRPQGIASNSRSTTTCSKT